MKHSYSDLASLGGDTNDTCVTTLRQQLDFYSNLMPRVKMIHTASRSGTSVTGLEGLLVVTLAEIVGAGVDNNSALNMSR